MAGMAREVPLNPDLSAEEGPLIAADCLYWVAQNMPGFDYPRKSKTLVRHFPWWRPEQLWYPVVTVFAGATACSGPGFALQGHSVFTTFHSSLQEQYERELGSSGNPHKHVSLSTLGM